jgi:hypothetical protein
MPGDEDAEAQQHMDDIEEQQQLLEIHRAALKEHLKQRAMQGEMYAAQPTLQGIRENRAAIKRIKNTLRGWGVAVRDHHNDTERRRSDLDTLPSQAEKKKKKKDDRSRKHILTPEGRRHQVQPSDQRSREPASVPRIADRIKHPQIKILEENVPMSRKGNLNESSETSLDVDTISYTRQQARYLQSKNTEIQRISLRLDGIRYIPIEVDEPLRKIIRELYVELDDIIKWVDLVPNYVVCQSVSSSANQAKRRLGELNSHIIEQDVQSVKVKIPVVQVSINTLEQRVDDLRHEVIKALTEEGEDALVREAALKGYQEYPN